MLPSAENAPDSKIVAPPCVADDDVQPRAAGRIGGREFVSGQVGHEDVGGQPSAFEHRIPNFHFGRRRLQVVDRRRHGRVQLLRQRDDTELVPMACEHAQHEEVPAAKNVARHIASRLPKHRGHRNFLAHFGHMTTLTGLLSGERARLPLEAWRLLGKRHPRRWFLGFCYESPQPYCSMRASIHPGLTR
jgi:hypothetical protein